MKTYQIYKHTAPDGKAYIGQTCNRKRRDYNHKTCKRITPLTTAIIEHGWDSFLHETLATDLNKEDADTLEIALIESHSTLYPNGFNLHKGGEINIDGRFEINEAYLADVPLHKRRVSKVEAKSEVKLREQRLRDDKRRRVENKLKLAEDGKSHTERRKRVMAIPKEAYSRYQNH